MSIVKSFLAVSAILSIFASPLSAQPPGKTGAPETGLVIHVYDGDTILIKSGHRKLKVRLLGIDAPEKKGPYTKKEPYGPAAGIRLSQLALGKAVQLEYGASTLKDKFNRLLAHVILPDGTTANETLLKEGLAEAFHRGNYSRKGKYHKLEAAAKKACLGLWKVKRRRACGGR